MTDALIVNPYDIDAVAASMNQGLTMPLEERQARHKSLLAAIRASSARQFCQSFLAVLNAAPSDNPEKPADV